MKYPEYDSPFELTISDITSRMAKNLDEMSWQAVQRVGINVNKDTLLSALEYDSTRYREAFRRGEETGYTKRDEEIVRCKDCKHYDGNECMIKMGWFAVLPDWFCADGERKET